MISSTFQNYRYHTVEVTNLLTRAIHNQPVYAEHGEAALELVRKTYPNPLLWEVKVKTNEPLLESIPETAAAPQLVTVQEPQDASCPVGSVPTWTGFDSDGA